MYPILSDISQMSTIENDRRIYSLSIRNTVALNYVNSAIHLFVRVKYIYRFCTVCSPRFQWCIISDKPCISWQYWHVYTNTIQIKNHLGCGFPNQNILSIYDKYIHPDTSLRCDVGVKHTCIENKLNLIQKQIVFKTYFIVYYGMLRLGL